SKGRTVADSIAARLTRPTVYKFKTDCSIIPVWKKDTSTKLSRFNRYDSRRLKIQRRQSQSERKITKSLQRSKAKQVKDQDQVITSSSEDHDQGFKD
ncbi:hypothetical protein Tco_0781470, partial [Tanacetum coccineum]